jgi:hypothetical protein
MSLLIPFLALVVAAPCVWAQDTTEAEDERLPRIRINVDTSVGEDDREPGFQIDFDEEATKAADYVRFGESIRIERGEHIVGDVVAIGGNITVEGKVSGDCVAVGGNIWLEDGAAVTGDVVCVGGSLTLGDSTRVGRDAVSVWGDLDASPTAMVYGELTEVSGLGFDFPTNVTLFGERRGFAGNLWRFISRAVWIVILAGLGVLAFNLFPTRMQRLSDTVNGRGLVAFLAGLAGWILWLPALILLMVTFVGIPVAILQIFLTPIVVLLGYLAVAEVVGKKTGAGNGSLFRTLFVGVLLLEGILLAGRFFSILGSVFQVLGFGLAVFGWSIILIAATTGFGAFLMTRFRPHQEPAPAGGVQGPHAPGVPPAPSGPPVPQAPPPPGTP